MMYSILRLSTLIFVMAIASPAVADSWPMPRAQMATSPDGQIRITIIPAPIDSQLAYFETEVEAQSSGKPVERQAPLATVEHLDASDGWIARSTFPLANQIAPVDMLVSDDGHLVTFDNWHSMGHGENVVVLYAPDGEITRSLSLADFLPENYIAALPMSVSSLHWRKEVAFSGGGRKVKIAVVIPHDGSRSREIVDFELDVSRGAIAPHNTSEWRLAEEKAALRLASIRASEEADLAFLRDPLVSPDTCETRDWYAYLREAFQRLTPDYLDNPIANTKVLFPPDHERFKNSLGWLREAIIDEADRGGDLAIAAPCSQPAMLETFAEVLFDIEAGTLAQSNLFVATEKSYHERIRQLFASTGAELFLIDVDQPIAQRPERVPGSPEADAAEREIGERQMAEVEAMMDELAE